MYALLVLWDLSQGSKMSIEELRHYIRDESMAKFRAKDALRQKVWVSNAETGRWGAMYLFETREAAEAQARTLTKPEEMTGVKPTIELFEVEAVVEGQHSGTDLLAAGLVWGEQAGRNA
jgi:hypothetical protein